METKEIIEEFDKKFEEDYNNMPENFERVPQTHLKEYFGDFLSKALTSQREEFRKMVEDKLNSYCVDCVVGDCNKLKCDCPCHNYSQGLEGILKQLK